MNKSIFVEKPNLPKFNVSELIVSGRYKFVIDELKRLGISIIESDTVSYTHLIVRIAASVEQKCSSINRASSVEEIQDMVEQKIMEQGAFKVAKRYIKYRYNRTLVRRANTTDNQILSLIECNNEEVKQENSNKNPTFNSVQRDYMAGEVSNCLLYTSRCV